jgi:hypothetical protein
VDALPSTDGTKEFKVDKLRALEPTHVILNIDENTKELSEMLQTFYRYAVVSHSTKPLDSPDLLLMLGGMFT